MEFIVILKGESLASKHLSPAETQAITDRYGKWLDDLKSSGRYRGGAAIRARSQILRGHRQLVLIEEGEKENRPGPTGYFIIQADGLTDAVELVKGCPALEHREVAEVFELDTPD